MSYNVDTFLQEIAWAIVEARAFGRAFGAGDPHTVRAAQRVLRLIESYRRVLATQSR